MGLGSCPKISELKAFQRNDTRYTLLVAQMVKNLPAMQETWVQFLGQDDPIEKERLPTPVFLPGEFHGLYSPWGHKE